MFNDKYGLTNAVLEGRKTMTRRIAFCGEIKNFHRGYLTEGVLAGSLALIDGGMIVAKSKFKLGEVVAVAQSYKSVFEESLNYALPRYHWLDDHIDEKGYTNKMFVKAGEMPHQIRITNIKAERLQDISDEDCFKEGITMITEGKIEIGNAYGWDTQIDALKRDSFFTPRAAFAALIDKVSGKGTWDRNDWQFAYTFKLVK